jgi:alkylation response protein AidB-like acyl-CoA dehydrogenase
MVTDDAALVDELAERLLREAPPDRVPPAEFLGRQFDLGLAWVHFPVGHGGLDVDPKLQQRVTARLRDVGAPDNRFANFMGVGMAAPTIVAFGTDAQRERFLRPLFTCEEIWCQLFSEPGAGSDLAGLATTAVRQPDGDWVLSGQKVWTTLAHVAKWAMILARTDPDVPKHKGLTYFLIDMEQPGVEVRPLRQLTGEAEFNEVYLTDARTPDALRIGEIGQGWQVAVTTLMNERVALGGLGNAPRGSGPIRHALRLWRAHGRSDAARRDELLQLWIKGELLRLTGLRAQAMRQRGTPGPEGAVGKLAMTEYNQQVFDFIADLRGLDATLIDHYEMVRPTTMSEDVLSDNDDIDLTKAFLTVRGTSIGGGTTEIARNVLAERVLGLPGDLRLDKDVAWREVPRS